MMSEAPKLVWFQHTDSRLNHCWVDEDGRYTVSQVIANDKLNWTPSGPDLTEPAPYLASERDAKVWCQSREDEAWRAAHPEPEPAEAVREFTDAELWAAVEDYKILISPIGWASDSLALGHEQRWFVKSLIDHRFMYETDSPQEGIAAYLRSRQPEPMATVEGETESEMTVAELGKLLSVNDLVVRHYPNERPDRVWNVWHRDDYRLGDIFAADLVTAVRQCIAAIETEKRQAKFAEHMGNMNV